MTRSSRTRHWTRMKKLTTIFSSILFGAVVIGCGEDGILLAEIIASSQNPQSPAEDPAEEPTDVPAVPMTPPETASPEEVILVDTFNRYCSDCHTDDPNTASGSLDNIDDIDALITRGLIVPGDREASYIYERMRAGNMPPAFIRDNRPSRAEIEAVGAAIDAL